MANIEAVQKFTLNKRKAKCRLLYFELRREFPSREDLATVLLEKVKLEPKGYLIAVMHKWFAAWDIEDEQDSDFQEINERFRDLQSMLDDAKAILQDALAMARKTGDSMNIDRVGSALRNFGMLMKQVDEYQEKLGSDQQARIAKPLTEQKAKSWAKVLKAHYHGKGPQYEMLCRQAAEWQAKLDVYGAVVSTAEAKELSRMHLAYLAELKKHTESMKSTSSTDMDKVMKEVLQIVEARLGTAGAPTLRLIVGDIKDRLASKAG